MQVNSPEESQELEYCKCVVLSVEDEMGVRTIMEELLYAVVHEVNNHALCTASVLILHAFCANTQEDIDDYLPQLFRAIIGLFARSDEKLLITGWSCLDAITKVHNL